MSSYNWRHLNQIYPHLFTAKATSELIEKLGVSETIARLLLSRNISSFDQAKSFFRPNLQKLHDPHLMRNMTEAVHLIRKHVTQNHQILIYGDYDVDGTCGVTILYDYLQNLGAKVAYYIPNRYHEGYGVSNQGIDFAIDNE